MKVALIRHLAPEIEAGLCYGRLDMPMRPAPDEIIRITAGPALRGSALIWTSPARRCADLAEAIATALGIPLTTDNRLQELDFGAWEGQPWDLVARTDLDRWAADPLTFAPPGGESGETLIERVRGFHTDLCQDRRDCIVVSHGGPLKVLKALLHGTPIYLLAAPPQMGSINVIDTP